MRDLICILLLIFVVFLVGFMMYKPGASFTDEKAQIAAKFPQGEITHKIADVVGPIVLLCATIGGACCFFRRFRHKRIAN